MIRKLHIYLKRTESIKILKREKRQLAIWNFVQLRHQGTALTGTAIRNNSYKFTQISLHDVAVECT